MGNAKDMRNTKDMKSSSTKVEQFQQEKKQAIALMAASKRF